MRVFLTLILTSIPYLMNSQTVRKIVDSNSKFPVPFATIKFLNKPNGLIASEKGEFDAAIEKSDSVLISSAGYYSSILTGDKIEAIIYLAPKIKTLTDIKIKSKRIVRSLLIGNNDQKFKDAFNWGPAYNGMKEEFAQKMELPDSSLTYRVKRILIPVSKIRCWGSFFIRVYSADSSGTLPGEELFMKSVSVNETNVRKKQVEIGVSDSNLFIHESRLFFVSVSWPEEAYHNKCLTAIMVSKNSNQLTYVRRLTSKNYTWSQFETLKKPDGTSDQAATMFSVLVEELR